MKRNIQALAAIVILGSFIAVSAQNYDDIYYNPKKSQKQGTTINNANDSYYQYNNSYNANVKNYTKTDTTATGINMDVDEYNRRGDSEYYPQDSLQDTTYYAPQNESAVQQNDDQNDFTYTERIRKYYNPTIIINANDPSLYDALYYATTDWFYSPYNIGLSIGNWGWSFNWGWNYSYWNPWSWSYPYWNYGWYGPSWGWGCGGGWHHHVSPPYGGGGGYYGNNGGRRPFGYAGGSNGNSGYATNGGRRPGNYNNGNMINSVGNNNQPTYNTTGNHRRPGSSISNAGTSSQVDNSSRSGNKNNSNSNSYRRPQRESSSYNTNEYRETNRDNNSYQRESRSSSFDRGSFGNSSGGGRGSFGGGGGGSFGGGGGGGHRDGGRR